jgi:hypothetical protein
VAILISPLLGTPRILIVTLAGVLAGAVLERVLRPPKVAQERWLGSYSWRWASISSTIAFGLLFALADALGRRVPFLGAMEQIWRPLYMSLCFAGALMLIRLDAWRRRKAVRRSGRASRPV